MTIRSYQYTVQLLFTESNLSFTVADTLGLTDEASSGQRRVVVDELLLADGAGAFSAPSGAIRVDQDLGLTQEVDVFGLITLDPDELNLNQTASAVFPLVRSGTQNVNLTEFLTFGFKVRNFAIEDQLNLGNDAGVALPQNITQPLNLASIAFRSFTPSSELTLTDEALWGYGYDVFDVIPFANLADRDLILNQFLDSTNVVTQSLTWFLESRCARYTFNTFHGEGGVAPTPAKLNYENQFTLTSIDDGTTITLRNPETDDRRRYNFNRVNRNFLDGSPDVFTDDAWITDESQIYTIVSTKRADLESVQQFLLDNLGREIVVKDWKGVSWVVIITNPGEIYTEDAEGFWTLVFETSGESVDGELVFDRLGLDDTLSRSGSIWLRGTSDDLNLVSRAPRHFDEDVVDDPLLSATLGDAATYTVESA